MIVNRKPDPLTTAIEWHERIKCVLLGFNKPTTPKEKESFEKN